jgi:hypothetical protein
MILLAASTFMGVVLSSLGTPTFIANSLLSWDLPPWIFLSGILAVCFILGWPLEWVPIVVVIVPIFLPVIMELNINMIWFCILLAVVLQTCWLSPPVALSAYYIKESWAWLWFISSRSFRFGFPNFCSVERKVGSSNSNPPWPVLKVRNWPKKSLTAMKSL